MWEMGNRLISKFKSASPAVSQVSQIAEVPAYLEPPSSYLQPQHAGTSKFKSASPVSQIAEVPASSYIEPPSYLPQYAGYNYYDVGQHYLDEELCASPTSSTPSYLPSPASSSQIPQNGGKKPRKTPVKTSVVKSTATVFDACIDASYTRLSGIQWVESEYVPLTPYKNKMIYAKVVDVYDGDTITILIMYGDAPMKLKVRLQGVDAPELVVKKKPGKVYTAEEEELMALEMRAGAHVRDKVKKLIDKKEVIVKLIKCDKYGGRQVGAVYLKPQSYETLTEYLLSKRYGKPYQAQKKDDWTKEELLYILSN